MSETRTKLSLDAALAAFPSAEKSASDWEEMARSIDERVKALELDHPGANVSAEELLIHPLGQIEGEGHNSAAGVTTLETPRKDASKGRTMTMQPDRERDRRSLQDLAKLATTGMTPPPPSSIAAPFSVPASAASLPSIPSIPSTPHSVSPASGFMGAPPSRVSSAPAVGGSGSGKNDDSGIVDLAMAAQADPQAAVRAQTTPLASGGLFDDEPASLPPFSSASAALHQQPAPSLPPFSMPPASMPPASLQAPPSSMGPASLAPNSAPASLRSLAPAAPISSSSLEGGLHASFQPKQKKGGVVLLLGALVAIAAVAAGGFFVVKGQRAKADAAAAAAAANAKANAVAAAPETKPADPVAANATPTPSSPAEMDPNALPTADAKLAVVAPKPGAPATKPAAVAVAAPAKDESSKVSQKDLPTAPTGPGGDLGAAMKGAVGDKDQKAMAPAADNGPQFAAGTVPQKPSQGAVTGAIGAVLPAARACLGPDDAVSRASITFASAGTVTGVNVSGGAAGKPAGECIKGALMKAKVAPFAEASYTANVTVRH